MVQEEELRWTGPAFGGLNANGKPDEKIRRKKEQKTDSGGLNAMKNPEVTGSKKRKRNDSSQEGKDDDEETANGRQASKSPARNIKAGRIGKAKQNKRSKQSSSSRRQKIANWPK